MEPWAQRFFEHSADLLLVLDSDGRILQVSPSWSRMPGGSPPVQGMQRFASFVLPEDLASVESQLQALKGTDTRASFSCRWRWQDGTTSWLSWSVSASASDGGFYCSARPVESEGKGLSAALARTEDALLRSEANFRKLIESAPESICVHRDRRFIYVNPAMLAALRYERASDLIGKSILDVIHPDDRERVRQRVQNVIATGKPVPPMEMRSLRSDGSSYDTETVALALDFDGAPSVMVLARDITERKQMQAQLLQTDRMVVMGTLAAGVGHEINNPLTYVLSNLSLAGTEMEQLVHACEQDTPEVADLASWRSRLEDLREMLTEAHAGAERVRTIVRDLKIFSRQEEEKRTAVDVREVLELAIKMSFHELRSRARLLKHFELVPHVYADASRLGQVFLNLLVNAAQAIPEGTAQGQEISVRVRHDSSGRVAVEVSDTGVGIRADLLPHIFEPFFTTKPVGSGTGLGLSICHGIIQSLGGDITVRSEVGRGTTFTVLLPVAQWVSSSAETTPTPVNKLSGKVLVIDDEPGVGRALARMVGNRNQVTVLDSGQEALKRLLSGESFDAIFCDLMMPDLSGMDLYERMRELRPGLAERFIFMTGGAFTPRAREFLERVPNGWIEKPFEVQQLLRLLGRVLREHHGPADAASPSK